MRRQVGDRRQGDGLARLRVAIIGSRGIPPAYGGFETLAWELSSRLAARGHRVTVYAYRGRTDETLALPDGVRRRFVPGLAGKHLETVTHTAVALVDALRVGYDVVLLLNAANAAFAWLPRLRGTPVALNVDGIERQRAKWGRAGQLWYAAGERFALVFPNEIVADAEVIRQYFFERYRKHSSLIAYGAPIIERDPPPSLASVGLPDVAPGRYILYVSRLEPENQADVVIEAYRDVPGEIPLIVVGDAPYAAGYKEHLHTLAAADQRVRLTGAIYGQGYRDLQRAALAYVQATSVGGTHPALIEAMGAGNLVLVFDTPENREVLAGTGILFSGRRELADHLARVVADPWNAELTRLRAEAVDRVRDVYSWDAVTSAYEALFERLSGSRRER
jgi:glycosyltransferase involved in cell wall biosynthesis